jgi:small subunit ribosomal protein S5
MVEEKIKKETEKEEIVEDIEDDEDEAKKEIEKASKISVDLSSWHPKTGLGLSVKTGEIKNIDEILDSGLKILEPEIVDVLIPTLEKDLLLIGQSKGKFGGGQRRVFKQTQKKTPEGNKPHFATFAVVGNGNGYIGVGYGKAKETVPAREKAFRNAKLSIMKIKRGCGSWQCGCKNPHSIPYQVEGKCSSVRIVLIPAPKGTGLKIEGSCATILKLAGIKDIWSKSFGQTKSKINLIKALIEALNKLNATKLKTEDYENLGIIEGQIKNN